MYLLIILRVESLQLNYKVRQIVDQTIIHLLHDKKHNVNYLTGVKQGNF